MWNRRTNSLDFFSFLNRCTLSRVTVGCNLYILFLVVDILVENTIFRKHFLAYELYIYNLFLPSYKNNLRALHQNPEELVLEPILFASCLSCLLVFPLNKSEKYISHSGFGFCFPKALFYVSCCTSELKFPSSLPSFTLCFSRPKMSKYQADGITFGTPLC